MGDIILCGRHGNILCGCRDRASVVGEAPQRGRNGRHVSFKVAAEGLKVIALGLDGSVGHRLHF